VVLGVQALVGATKNRKKWVILLTFRMRHHPLFDPKKGKQYLKAQNYYMIVI